MPNNEAKQLIEDAITNPTQKMNQSTKLVKNSFYGMDLINKVDDEFHNEKSTNREAISKKC